MLSDRVKLEFEGVVIINRSCVKRFPASQLLSGDVDRGKLNKQSACRHQITTSNCFPCVFSS